MQLTSEIVPANVAQRWMFAADDWSAAAQERSRPSVLFRPSLALDGDQWCALYGPNLQVGVSGFGDSPDAAMRAFDAAWATG